MKDILWLHGFLKVIILDRDPKFTLNFWKSWFEDLGTQLNFSIAYHPQTNDKIERVNQVLEDMLHMYVMSMPTKWEDYLPLVEFNYNNGQQKNLGMSLLKFMYGRKYRTSVHWDGSVNRLIVGLDMLTEMEQREIRIRQHLKTTLDR